MNEAEMVVHRFIIVELMAQTAALQPQPKEWLANLAGKLARHGAEVQQEWPDLAEGATAIRAIASEITEAADEALSGILRARSRDL